MTEIQALVILFLLVAIILFEIFNRKIKKEK